MRYSLENIVSIFSNALSMWENVVFIFFISSSTVLVMCFPSSLAGSIFLPFTIILLLEDITVVVLEEKRRIILLKACEKFIKSFVKVGCFVYQSKTNRKTFINLIFSIAPAFTFYTLSYFSSFVKHKSSSAGSKTSIQPSTFKHCPQNTLAICRVTSGGTLDTYNTFLRGFPHFLRCLTPILSFLRPNYTVIRCSTRPRYSISPLCINLLCMKDKSKFFCSCCSPPFFC